MKRVGNMKFSWKRVSNIDAYKILILKNDIWNELVYIQNISITNISISDLQYDKEWPIKVQYIRNDNNSDIVVKEIIYYCFLVGKEKTYQYKHKTPRQISVKLTSEGNYVSWEVIEGVSLYRVHRRLGKKGKWERIALTQVNEFLDSKKGADFYYTIRCIDDDRVKFLSSYDRKGACVVEE